MRSISCPGCQRLIPASHSTCLICGTPIREQPAPPKSKVPRWVLQAAYIMVALMPVWGVALLVVTVFSVVYWTFHSPSPSSDSSVYVEQAQKPAALSRNEFFNRVFNKKAGEIIAAVGIPDHRQQSGKMQYWYYVGRTYDPLTKKIDTQVQLVIDFDLCTDVNFY